MRPPWGINWQSYHKDMGDMPHVQAMGYKAFTLYEWMWSDAGFMAELLPVTRPDAIFLCRDHPLSEQKDDEWKSNPYLKGLNHAYEWVKKVQQGRVFTPLDRTYFLGINEPDSNHYQWQIDQYNEAFCRRLAEHGLKAAAYSFGVGHPSTVDSRPDTLPDWTAYAASARAVLEGGHIVAVHEYGAPEVGGYGWGYWCNRLEHCPYPFDVVLDECGIDNGVVESGQLYGWAKFMDGDAYLQWLDGFQVGQAERAHTRKARIIAYNIFSYDHGRGDSKDWHSFDIRSIRPQLETYNWTISTPTTTANTTHLPSIHSGTPSPTNIEPTPQPIDANDNWTRCREFVKRSEGGYQDNELDSGNWTGGTVGVGIKKGTKYGISAASYPYLDIINLTIEQADAIYFRDYWQASGADKMPWPLCLLVFDTAVLHGLGTSTVWLVEVGDSPYAFAAKRLQVYTRLKNWGEFGRGWVNRVADLLIAVGES